MPDIILERTEMAVFCQLFRTTKTYGWKYPWIGAGKRRIRIESQEALETLQTRNMVILQSNGKISVPEEVRDIMRTCCKPNAYLSLHAEGASVSGKSMIVCDKNGLCEINERGGKVRVAPYIGRKALFTRMNAYLGAGEPMDGEWIVSNEALAALRDSPGGQSLEAKALPDALVRALLEPEYKIAYAAENYDFNMMTAAILLKSGSRVFVLERFGGGNQTRAAALDAERSEKLYAELLEILVMERDDD